MNENNAAGIAMAVLMFVAIVVAWRWLRPLKPIRLDSTSELPSYPYSGEPYERLKPIRLDATSEPASEPRDCRDWYLRLGLCIATMFAALAAGCASIVPPILLIVSVAYVCFRLRPFSRTRSDCASGAKSDPRDYRHWTVRLLLGFITAATVYFTAFFCAWYEYRAFPNLHLEHQRTRSTLETVRKDIQDYQRDNAKLPTTLSDVYPKRDVQEEDSGLLKDGWQRPLVYRVENERFELLSYGKDGQPGGIGFDADIYSDQLTSRDHLPTFRQFNSAWGVGGIKGVCLLSGIFVFLLFFSYDKNRHHRPALLTLFVTAIFSVFAAVVISMLHLPSGH